MQSFFNILQTLINKKYKTSPDDPFVLFNRDNETMNTKYSYHIDILINNIYIFTQNNNYINTNYHTINSYSKLVALTTMLSNSFYTNELKEYIFDIFSKAQKHYHAFSRLALLYKHKTYNIVVSTDLMLTPLDINHKSTFKIVEHKYIYLFNINDIVSIVETSIGNAPNFFLEPKYPVNPYNNQLFSSSTLYNIYFKLKSSGRLMSTLFHLFFLEPTALHQIWSYSFLHFSLYCNFYCSFCFFFLLYFNFITIIHNIITIFVFSNVIHAR